MPIYSQIYNLLVLRKCLLFYFFEFLSMVIVVPSSSSTYLPPSPLMTTTTRRMAQQQLRHFRFRHSSSYLLLWCSWLVASFVHPNGSLQVAMAMMNTTTTNSITTTASTTTTGTKMVQVLVGLDTEVHMDHFIQKLLPTYGGTVRYRFNRTNAVAITIPDKFISSLKLLDMIDHVEDDDMKYHFEEQVSYGIPLTQSDSTAIPLPPTGSSASTTGTANGCFRVCVVDSGVFIGHPDIPYSLKGNNVIGAQFDLPQGQYWYNPAASAAHGTHTTGIIFAQGGNGIGIRGVIPDSRNICLMMARVFPDNSMGAIDSTVLAAVEWCANNKARVINLSLGGSTTSQTAANVYNNIVSANNVLIIAASGNDGDNTYNYPASYSNIISVAAVDSTRTRAVFSNYNDQVDITAPGVAILSTVPVRAMQDNNGKAYQVSLLQFSVPATASIKNVVVVDCGIGDAQCTDATNKVCLIQRGTVTFSAKAINCFAGGGTAVIIYNNLSGTYTGTLGSIASRPPIPVFSMSMADGMSLLATVGATVTLLPVFGGYAMQNGTSMAAPFVSGVAAKIWASRPRCRNSQIRDALLNTALDLGAPGRDEFYGNGLVQAERAYQYLLSLAPPCGRNTSTPVQSNWSYIAPASVTTGITTQTQKSKSVGGGNTRGRRAQLRVSS